MYNNHSNYNNKDNRIMKKSEDTTPIRELMPDGYLPKIAELTGVGRSTISNVVRDETITSKIWPAVEALAKETDSKAYAARMEFIKARRANFSGAAA